MARITVEDCLKEVGDGNRFNLIHLAVKRIKQHRQGEPFLVEAKNQEVVLTLREIAAGFVTFENIDDLPELNEVEESEESGDLEEETTV